MSNNTNVKENLLHTHALIPLLILTIVEYEVFTFSKATVAAAGQDAWLSIIIGASIGNIFVYLFIKLAARFPHMNYFQYLKIVWGKPIGFLISLLYLLFWIMFLTSIFYETILTNKLLFLPRTPIILPLALFVLALVWLVSYGLIPIIRFFQVLLPFLVIPLILLAVLFTTSIRIDQFRPVLEDGVLPVLKGSVLFIGAYQGPEVLLFAAPFFLRIKDGVKPALFGYNATVLFGLTNTVAAIGILGVENIKEAVMPGINVVNILELPGFTVERFGLLLTLPWLIAIFTTLAIYLYLLTSGTFQLFQLNRKNWLIFGITAVPATLAFLLPDESWHEALRLYLTLLTVPIVYLLPVLTLLLAILRKKGKSS